VVQHGGICIKTLMTRSGIWCSSIATKTSILIPYWQSHQSYMINSFMMRPHWHSRLSCQLIPFIIFLHGHPLLFTNMCNFWEGYEHLLVVTTLIGSPIDTIKWRCHFYDMKILELPYFNCDRNISIHT
jgi:hypothetical protein